MEENKPNDLNNQGATTGSAVRMARLRQMIQEAREKGVLEKDGMPTPTALNLEQEQKALDREAKLATDPLEQERIRRAQVDKEADTLAQDLSCRIDLIIDSDFKSALPAPRVEEIAELEKQIRDHGGCYSPLIVWRTERGLVLVDGHHRYEIFRRLDLAFRVEEKQFESRDAALAWVVETQVGRRNLTDSWSRYLLGRKYEALKRQGQRTDLSSGQNVQKLTAAEKIAGETGNNEKTVRRAAAYARAIDKIGAVNPEAKQKILSEEIDLAGEEIVALADRPAAIESLSSDRATPGFVRQVLRKERQREKYGALVQQGTPAPGEDWPRFTVVYADQPRTFEFFFSVLRLKRQIVVLGSYFVCFVRCGGRVDRLPVCTRVRLN
jgi:hypothetical protein